jgi:hypothetical protein
VFAQEGVCGLRRNASFWCVLTPGHDGECEAAPEPGDLVELADVRTSREGAAKIEVIATWWDRGDGTLERIVEASEGVDRSWIADELADIAREMREDL